MITRVLLLLSLCFSATQTTAMTFAHPGVIVSQTQLDYMKAQVLAGAEPFASTFAKAKASRWGSLTYTVQGPPSDGEIVCGSFSNPNHGCSLENTDSEVAMTQALLWYITGNTQYAKNVISILNTYARVLTKGHSDSNGPLQSSWTGQKFPAAAEIIYYSNAGWSKAEFQAFQNMLTTQYLNSMTAESLRYMNGNWAMTYISAWFGIAVVTENSALYDKAVAAIKEAIPAYLYYFPEDGSTPKTSLLVSEKWNGQTVFDATTSGICQETCRDLQHAQFGYAGIFNALETAYIQGTDLYGLFQDRLITSMEFNTALFPKGFSGTNSGGDKVPSPKNVCGGTVMATVNPTLEIAYNHYHNRKGVNLPNTFTYIQNSVRKMTFLENTSGQDHPTAFESLHHGGEPVSSTTTTSTTGKPTASSGATASPSAETENPSDATEKPSEGVTDAPEPSITVAPGGDDAKKDGGDSVVQGDGQGTKVPIVPIAAACVGVVVVAVLALVAIRRRSKYKPRAISGRTKRRGTNVNPIHGELEMHTVPRNPAVAKPAFPVKKEKKEQQATGDPAEEM